jgi:hypothetical protein
LLGPLPPQLLAGNGVCATGVRMGIFEIRTTEPIGSVVGRRGMRHRPASATGAPS